MTITLRRKIILLAAASAVLPVLCLQLLLTWGKGEVSQKIDADLYDLARKNIEQIARDVYAMCGITRDTTQRYLSQSMGAIHHILDKHGTVSLAKETVVWEAADQDTGRAERVELPRMLLGGDWLGQNTDFGTPSPVVDEIFLLTGLDTTLFQRMNERGDMLRVASHLKAKDNRRSTGTFIPAVEKDNQPNPVIQSILAGQSYRGMVNYWGQSSVTAYDPLLNAEGRVIGMVGTGMKAEAMDLLIRTIREIRVGSTGYVFVLGMHKERRGVYLISKDRKRDGENLLNFRDPTGRFLIREMVETAEKSARGEISHFRYLWLNPEDKAPRAKIAAVIYFEPFDWVIGVGTYEDDYFTARLAVDDHLSGLLVNLTLAGCVLLVLAAGTAILLGNRIARPLGLVTGLAQHVARGDILEARYGLSAMTEASGEREPGGAKDEIRQLTGAFRAMTDHLAGLIGQVQAASMAATASTTQIAASARQLEATVAEQAASTRQVTASSREISQRSQELVQTVGEVSETVKETAGLAQTGQGEIARMGAAMGRLVKATEAISTRLSVINDRANRISNVVTAINKISDQTTLLSLNAAIEAEKAGEYGRGFSVVAREVSRLADRTAAATQDIENMVREMQSSVSSGVMEMDKFADEVRRGVSEVGSIGQRLERIIDEVRTLEPRFLSVTGGMDAQSESARQISESMDQLSQTAEQTRQALSEFKRVAEHLDDAVKELLAEISHFRVVERPSGE